MYQRMGPSHRTPGKWEVLQTPFHNVRIVEDVMAVVPRYRIDNVRQNRWLPELLEVARNGNCSTIKCLTTQRLTPNHHHETLLEHGFTMQGEGDVLGELVNRLDIRTPELLVETTDTGRSLAAALRLSSALWGTPSMEPAVITAILDEIANIPVHERDKHDIVVWIDDQPAGIGNLAVDGDVATLGEAVTLPQYRHHGVYSATVDSRLQIANNIGCNQVIAHTNNRWATTVLRSRGLDVIDTTTLYTRSL